MRESEFTTSMFIAKKLLWDTNRAPRLVRVAFSFDPVCRGCSSFGTDVILAHVVSNSMRNVSASDRTTSTFEQLHPSLSYNFLPGYHSTLVLLLRS